MAPEFGVAQSGGGRHFVLNSLVGALHRPIISVLEIGSFEGQSALIWSAVITQHCQRGRVLCVDPWSPKYIEKYLGQGAAYETMADALRSGEAYRRFKYNIAFADARAPISHLVGTLRDVYDILRGEQFDIVYIDGDHSASAVSEDIELARPLVKVGGLMCGDDLEAQGGGVDWDSTVAVSETTDYVGATHPGEPVAVWLAFGQVWSSIGVWAVLKTDTNAWQPPERV